MKSKPKGAKAIFLTDRGSRIEMIRAYAIGATDVVNRPTDPKVLLQTLRGDFTALTADASDFAAGTAQGVVAAHDGLQNIFSSAVLGETLDQAAIGAASTAVVGEIESQGLASWVDTVRKHHSQTYQHCLLVTGVAVAFGKHLGLSQTDRKRLSFAGMLHDIGKARIPVAILEKPGPLDAEERTIMQEHPQLGADALATAKELHPEMMDMVLHHHEYLDGSGYPHGLKGSEISDLVRVMTIADVFGALIERRSYKPPFSNDKAYQILLDMGAKLDTSLVREFRFISHVR
jgi:putative nucleotidyltransferase with HDIG domain